jgi:hypothetical protein
MIRALPNGAIACGMRPLPARFGRGAGYSFSTSPIFERGGAATLAELIPLG